MGHIRFWKMAKTFTGLKLQGAIGKFGRIDLSDIVDYDILPDGKVLSSCESGSLLLWEGNFIKIEVGRPDGAKAHDGAIHVVNLDREENQFITAGEDGVIRFWDFAGIDNAEPTDDMPIYEAAPTREIEVGKGVDIRYLLRGDGHWVVQDAQGAIYKVDETTDRVTTVLEFHAGAINALNASPIDHFAASTGEDGTVRLWDYVENKCLYQSKFATAGVSMDWAPSTVDSATRTIAVGFASGVVQSLENNAVAACSLNQW